jgi:Trypsin
MTSRRTIALPSFGLLLSFVAACASNSGEPNPSESGLPQAQIARLRQAIINGKVSVDDQDATVLLFNTSKFGICTGTLLSPNVILTARHCVSETDQGATCSDKGVPINGGVVGPTLKPGNLWVFKGVNQPDQTRGIPTPDGIGAKIIDDGSRTLCNRDLALVITKDPIANAKIAPVRLNGPPKRGEMLTAVGWGLTQAGDTPTQRQQRENVPVLRVGPLALQRIDANTSLGLGDAEFMVGESICSGDSGGPVFAPGGAVVGVVSRGGNGKQPSQQQPQAACIGAQTINFYTHPAGRKDLIMKAFAEAGGAPWEEGQPNPNLKKLGETCADGAECSSASCLGTVCAPTDCKTEACPAGYICDSSGDKGACVPEVKPMPMEEPKPMEPVMEAPVDEEPPAPVAAPTTNVNVSSGCATGGSSGNMLGLCVAAFGLALARTRRRSAAADFLVQ